MAGISPTSELRNRGKLHIRSQIKSKGLLYALRISTIIIIALAILFFVMGESSEKKSQAPVPTKPAQ